LIRSFGDSETRELFDGVSRRRSRAIERQALRRLIQIHRAASLRDLAVVNGNRLEAPVGDRRGQHSIRINDQWRICFVWREPDAWGVEIVDYH
jgi:proteic killer suppression protein